MIRVDACACSIMLLEKYANLFFILLISLLFDDVSRPSLPKIVKPALGAQNNGFISSISSGTGALFGYPLGLVILDQVLSFH